MSRCPYCHIDDGEGHTVTCSYNNQSLERERRQQEEIDSMSTSDLLRAIYRSLNRS